jgi:hypothetical protein
MPWLAQVDMRCRTGEVEDDEGAAIRGAGMERAGSACGVSEDGP